MFGFRFFFCENGKLQVSTILGYLEMKEAKKQGPQSPQRHFLAQDWGTQRTCKHGCFNIFRKTLENPSFWRLLGSCGDFWPRLSKADNMATPLVIDETL